MVVIRLAPEGSRGATCRGGTESPAAGMHETRPLTWAATKDPAGIEAAALRAEAWAGEPFLRPDEDAAVVLAPGTAFRNALDAALAEMEAGHKAPTPEWKVRFALMLGLERVLSEKPPRLASGTELRRHQVDALAGMLTELIAASQKHENGNGNGTNGAVAVEEVEEDEEDDDFTLADESEEPLPLPAPQDPGAERRYRFRHPTASGKTIAAAGFVEAARTEGVLILTHRRLLVDQFRRELTEHGYGGGFHDAILAGHTGARGGGGPSHAALPEGPPPPRASTPIPTQTSGWSPRHVDEIARDASQLVI